VFDSPHSGITYPDNFRPAAARSAVLTTWDAYVDELFAGVTTAGATLIAARFPRAYIDTNRAANDIDPALLESPWPEPTELSEHAGRGMGLIRRYALPGIPMYDRRLPVAEVRQRIERHYLPYRRTLQAEIDDAVARHGFVWHFNCHSMKSRGNAMNRDAGAPRPDFVLGDRDGTSAPRDFTAWVAAWLVAQGHRVAINEPYRGADIVRAHGAPARGRYSLQIEINRGLYLDEATCERAAGFAALQEELTRFALAVAEFARKCPPRPASG
jgi:N-formylglutamate deformylase